MEAVLLLARDEPLPPGEDDRLAAALGGLPRQGRLPDPRVAAWFENGDLVRGEDDRGPIRLGAARAVEDPVLRAQALLRDRLRPLPSYTRAVCYGFPGE